MTTVSGIGIGIGIGVVIGFGFAFVFLAGMNQDTPVLENIPSLVYDEPRLASIQTSYFEENNRLVLELILTDKNAEYTKADGVLIITIKKDGRQVYSDEYEFKKDDFLSWKNSSGVKVTGYRADIIQYFSGGSHDVFVSLATTSGITFIDVHDSFWALS